MTDTPSLAKKRLAICVFCGSSRGADDRHAAAARRLGALLAAGGHTLVFGGGQAGLMGEVARAARDGGGEVVGFLPEFLMQPERAFNRGARLTLTADLQERKQRMMELADGYVILPGGPGTLDEYFEVLTTKNLGLHDKPVAIVDSGGYFEPLKALLAHAVATGFARQEIMALQRFVATPEEAIAFLVR